MCIRSVSCYIPCSVQVHSGALVELSSRKWLSLMALELSNSRAMTRGCELRIEAARLSEVAPVIAVHFYLAGGTCLTPTDAASNSDNSYSQ